MRANHLVQLPIWIASKSAQGAVTDAAPQRLQTVSELHRLLGLPQPEHPLLSVVAIEPFAEPLSGPPVLVVTNVYIISLKKGFSGPVKIKHGQQSCDFDEGVLSFMAPGQVFGLDLPKFSSPPRRAGCCLCTRIFSGKRPWPSRFGAHRAGRGGALAHLARLPERAAAAAHGPHHAVAHSPAAAGEGQGEAVHHPLIGQRNCVPAGLRASAVVQSLIQGKNPAVARGFSALVQLGGLVTTSQPGNRALAANNGWLLVETLN